MSSDFIYAIIRTSIVLAPAYWLCLAQLCSHSIGIGSSLPADNESDEEALTGWVPEPNRH